MSSALSAVKSRTHRKGLRRTDAGRMATNTLSDDGSVVDSVKHALSTCGIGPDLWCTLSFDIIDIYLCSIRPVMVVRTARIYIVVVVRTARVLFVMVV